MKARLLRLLACSVTGALLAGLGACSSSPESSGGTVTISVSDLPPSTQGELRQQFLKRVAQFEREHPNIKIKPSEAVWEAKTFAARLAGGQLETVFIVPLTEPPGLIKRRQVADISEEVTKLPHADEFDQRALAPAQSPDGKTYGLPVSEYALGLIYNRELFAKAGLDPDKPPTTWEDVRAAAKAISKKTGVPGFGMPTTENTGGWVFTAMNYTYGGRLEREENGEFAATLDTAASREVLGALRAMRWEDNAMGKQQLRNAADVYKDFAAGKVGMTIGTPTVYGDHTTKFDGDPELFGVGSLPVGSTPATLLGGKIAVVSPKATPQERAAAVKWIDFYYLKQRYDPTYAEQVAKAKAADKVPVGMPTVLFYTPEVNDPVLKAERKHANVPLENFAPYEQGVAGQEFVVEPPVAAQDLYAALDAVVQAVLTRKSADPAAELRKAESKVTSALRRAQQ